MEVLTMSDQTSENLEATEAADQTNVQETVESRTYTQEEFNSHMSGLKKSMQRKYDKLFEELGDIDELRKIKAEAEERKQAEQIKRGEFETTLKELASRKDAEIQKRDSIIKEYKVNTPLLDAAARHKAVAPNQVKQLLSSNVRLNEEGDVEVLGEDGSVRYDDSGLPFTVEKLVFEFLESNPHFKQPTVSTTNTRSNAVAGKESSIDVSKLNMQNPEHRKIYGEYRKSQGLR
jgi:hypothetical protein